MRRATCRSPTTSRATTARPRPADPQPHSKDNNMEFFRIRRDIPFMRHALVFNIVSLVTFLAAVFFLVTRGLNLSIEFTGGTAVEVAYAQAAHLPPVRGIVDQL